MEIFRWNYCFCDNFFQLSAFRMGERACFKRAEEDQKGHIKEKIMHYFVNHYFDFAFDMEI